ncbi:MAG: chromate transporter [Clostridia bacterium]|nr:chromate transporter [Clostridia bacterium]
MLYWQLFCSFLQVGMFSIGGGYAAIPLIQSQVVATHGWLTLSEFTDLVTIAEMTPGPISVNSATFVGNRIAGVPGTLTATFACILPSLIIVSLLAFVYYRYKQLDVLQSVLACLRPAVVAMIASAGLSILRLVALNGEDVALAHVDWLGMAIFVSAFFALRKFRWNPILTMLACGAVRLLCALVSSCI